MVRHSRNVLVKKGIDRDQRQNSSGQVYERVYQNTSTQYVDKHHMRSVGTCILEKNIYFQVLNCHRGTVVIHKECSPIDNHQRVVRGTVHFWVSIYVNVIDCGRPLSTHDYY